MDDYKSQGAWRSGNRFALPTSPHPRRRLSEPKDKRATLTPHWYKRSGNPRVLAEHLHNAAILRYVRAVRVLGFDRCHPCFQTRIVYTRKSVRFIFVRAKHPKVRRVASHDVPEKCC